MKYEIDYEHCLARLWSRAPLNKPLETFEELAEQCFGIRKSIGDTKLLETIEEEIPDPWGPIPEIEFMLWHKGSMDNMPGLDPRVKLVGKFVDAMSEGDLIVWNNKGEKVKSEWNEEKEAWRKYHISA